ncbi:MAG: transposase [Candidatus Acidiferrales bacterium]|jgi:transposase-like protein
MANKKYHRVPKDVKADILRRVKEEGISVSVAAKDAGISDATIYTWLGTGAAGAPSWGEFSRLQKQNKELFEVIGELTVQLSAAKKKN